MHKINVKIDVPQQYLDYFILPIAVQMIIENAIKHNTFSKSRPMQIEISVGDKQQLIISNTLQLRETKLASTGIGLKNIVQRYALLCNCTPSFVQTEHLFVAELPLMKEYV